MSESSEHGGDISSGFGEADVEDGVSDEKAQQMKDNAKNQGRPKQDVEPTSTDDE